MSRSPLIELCGISKAFPAVRALIGVDFELRPGEIHTLAGENGSGKSTLMKVLAGVMRPDGGSILVEGEPQKFASARDALALGITYISQELTLVPGLSVAENIFLGRRKFRRLRGIDWRGTNEAAAALLRRLHLDIDPTVRVGSLPVHHRQLVELARALSYETRILVMDEPTSSLDPEEVHSLFLTMDQLKQAGVAIVFISHRMPEMLAVADRVTVLRDGRRVDSAPRADVDENWLVQRMVGRSLESFYPVRSEQRGGVVLSVRNISDRAGRVRDVSFDLCRGEVVGLAGLVGAGRTELVETVFGMRPRRSGEVRINGRRVPAHPVGAIAHRMALVPDDRKAKSAVLDMSVQDNVLLARRGARSGLRHGRAERDTLDEWVRRLGIRAAEPGAPLARLSGGNQQKVILARWLVLDPLVLLLDEPTRGIDIGGKAEIYRLITGLAADGLGVLMVSSEMEELLALSERVLVMHAGALVADLTDATEESVVAAATGAGARVAL